MFSFSHSSVTARFSTRNIFKGSHDSVHAANNKLHETHLEVRNGSTHSHRLPSALSGVYGWIVCAPCWVSHHASEYVCWACLQRHRWRWISYFSFCFMFDLNGSVISIHYLTQAWQDKVHKDWMSFHFSLIHCLAAQLENIHFLRVDGTNNFPSFFICTHIHIKQTNIKKREALCRRT